MTTPLRDLLDRAKARNLTIRPTTLAAYENVINLIDTWAATLDPVADPWATEKPLTCDSFFHWDHVERFVLWLMQTPWMGGKNLPAFDPATKWLRSSNTVRTKMLTVRTLWRLARRYKLCCQKPPSKPHWPRIDVRREDPVSWRRDELRLLLDASLKAKPIRGWTGQHWHALIWTYYVTIERFTCLLAAEAEHLSSDNVLRIFARSTKDGKPGVHRLPDWLADEIRALPRQDFPESVRHLLFPWPMKKQTLRNRLRRDILQMAGLPDSRYHLFHALRRTGVTEMVNELGLEAASQHARHTSKGLTVDRYVSQANLLGPTKADVLSRIIRPD